jgi:DNA-binding response OmpR family regulator
LRILVVEDEDELATALVEMLQHERYAVDHAPDGAAADSLVQLNDYDLVVLDWSIPPPTGVELVRRWRERERGVPVLMLTGRRGVADRVEGLDAGADDYLSKPFAFAELKARVRSLLRRRERPVVGALTAGDLELDRRTREVRLDGTLLHFTPKEFAVLEYLLIRRDEVVTRFELSEHAWDDSFDPRSNVIDVVLHRLRRKIDGDRENKLLWTVPGTGYMLKSRRS